MKVTAFHMINKLEEAARSYFSNSLLFSHQTIVVDRMVNFRSGRAGLHFFIDRGEAEERVPMGGMDFESVQERDNKVAFQCSLFILPSGEQRQFFLMVTANREPFTQYTRLVDLMRVRWEKHMEAYLPVGEDGLPMIPDGPEDDDEYGGLTAEEIEAVTGSRPDKPGTPPRAPHRAEPTPPVPAMDDLSEQLSADDIQRLMNMGVPGDAPSPAAGDDPSAGMMSLDDIEALTREFQKTPEPEAPAPKPQPGGNGKASGDIETELSAEDIWKQITGGKG